MKIHIYKIYFPEPDKCYIGQTNNLQKRMKEHLRSGYLVYKALYKYDDWQVSILHTCKTRDEANRIEIEEIRNSNSVAPNGYNLSAGGGGGALFTGKHHTEETKAKMCQAHLGKKRSEEMREKMRGNQNALGFKHTKEQLEKMRTPSEEIREKMRKASLGNQNAKGHKHSKETKLNMRLAQLKRRARELKQELDNEQ